MRLSFKNSPISILIIFLTIFGLSSGVSAATIRLAWDPNPPEDEVTGYIVYYGTASGKYTRTVDVGNATACELTGLTPGVTYYITLTAYDMYDNESDFSDEVSGFAKKEIELVAPNGRDVLKSGDSQLIQWGINWTKYAVTKVNLYYTMNGGTTWNLITPIATVDPGSRPWPMSYPWTVPTPLSNKKNTCYVKAVAYSGSRVVGSDRSDKPFTIEVVKVIQPNGGETLSSGSSYEIKWEINGTKYPVAMVKLYRSMDGGSNWGLIDTRDGASRSYSWTPNVKSKKTKCKVKIALYDTKKVALGSDVSDNYFTILGP